MINLKKVINCIELGLNHKKRQVKKNIVKKSTLLKLINNNVIVCYQKKKLTLNYTKGSNTLPNLAKNIK